MAKAIKFDDANHQLGAPKGMEDSVGTIHCHSTEDQCISCWELTDEEVAELVATKRIYVSIIGMRTHIGKATMPPLYISPLRSDFFPHALSDLFVCKVVMPVMGPNVKIWTAEEGLVADFAVTEEWIRLAKGRGIFYMEGLRDPDGKIVVITDRPEPIGKEW